MSGPPWAVGDRVQFATFDVEDADLRELDASIGTVMANDFDRDRVQVSSMYGLVWVDPYAVVAAKSQRERSW